MQHSSGCGNLAQLIVSWRIERVVSFHFYSHIWKSAMNTHFKIISCVSHTEKLTVYSCECV